ETYSPPHNSPGEDLARIKPRRDGQTGAQNQPNGERGKTLTLQS
ncbi:hypothetical protein HMPREF0298_1032, partial [Corynebacterium lipophiloflavum DSM 44291]